MKDLDIKTLSIDDLIQKIEVHKNNYQNIKFYNSVEMNKNPMIIRIIRKKIARLKTELNKKINDNRA
ncbi:50S ribosomal protein L29 [Blattabacterium cuenoti]|uniref:50S ribosomal protein L29 n=1 Tax=Blattabacterium cuenoti TaxID=1653831 RepID=UPI00163C277D|nr:50S ribosomal protein L29 [Blattabacterium cuenoti]